MKKGWNGVRTLSAGLAVCFALLPPFPVGMAEEVAPPSDEYAEIIAVQNQQEVSQPEDVIVVATVQTVEEPKAPDPTTPPTPAPTATPAPTPAPTATPAS